MTNKQYLSRPSLRWLQKAEDQVRFCKHEYLALLSMPEGEDALYPTRDELRK